MSPIARPRPPRSGRVVVARLLALLLPACCDQPSPFGGDLDAPPGDGERPALTSYVWRLRSFEVDADLWLASAVTSTSCVTSGGLWLDEAASGSEVYRLAERGCDSLQLAPDGDLVVLGLATGIDWRAVPLTADLGTRRLVLGPVVSGGLSFRFELYEQRCAGAPGCQCALLVGWREQVATTLELSRACE